MGFNDESLSDKILRLTDATSGALNQVVTGNYQTNAAKSEYQLKKSKYLHDLDNNVYSTSAQKALTGINNLFYGNSKTGVNGFFKDQLNDMNYEGYELGTTSMLENTLTADYLMENYGMTATHAERFIDEYADTITAEAMQRTQTNTWMAMTSQLGTDQKSYTALMAETGNSVTEQWTLSKDHYYENGGPSWDITGEFNPDRIENKLQFGYDWSISTGKTYVDTNLGKTGITLEQIVEGAMGYYDEAMSEMGDGSNISNATISASREEFEKYIRSYISTQSGYMYTESQDKARNASNALVQIQLDGNYVDKEHFEEILTDASLSRDNVYDLAFILDFEKNLFGSKNSSTNSTGVSADENLAINNYYLEDFNDVSKSYEDCLASLAEMQISGKITVAQYSALKKELDSRTTFASEGAATVMNVIEEQLKMSLGESGARPIMLRINNDPSYKSQIYKTIASHPEWVGTDGIYDFATNLSLSIQSTELSKQIDDLLELEFGEATGYVAEYDISNDDVNTVIAEMYSGKYSLFLKPEYSGRIMTSLFNDTFSNEKDFEESVSMMMFGKGTADLSTFEKNILHVNIIANAVNVKRFKEVTSVLEAIDDKNNTAKDYRMVEVYNFGAGAVSGDKVYFIGHNGYLNVMRMEVGDDNWNNLQENDGRYGVMVDPTTLLNVGRINLESEKENIVPGSQKEEATNTFGPLMAETTKILDEAKEIKTPFADKIESKTQTQRLSDTYFDFPKINVEQAATMSRLLDAMNSASKQKMGMTRIGGQSHERQ